MDENLTTTMGDELRLFLLRQGVLGIGSNDGGADILSYSSSQAVYLHITLLTLN